MTDLKNTLAEYGLSDKESLVFLAMLELGPASVQDIAKKAGVNRATTYVMIESLKRRGLMSTFEKGKKTMFVAENPEHLKKLAEVEMRAAQEKEDRLKSALPQFLALFHSAQSEKPVVRYFEGEDGVRTCREVIMQSSGEVLNFVAIDEASMRMAKIDERGRHEAAKRVHGRTLFAVKPGVEPSTFDKSNWKLRELPYQNLPFTGDVNLFDGNKSMFFAIAEEKPMAFLIESREIYNLLRALYEAAWLQGKPVE